jgi:sugar (pentulose or hexulose) kinase
MTALLGLDVGTTGARCVAIDETGRTLAEATAEYPATRGQMHALSALADR